MKLSHSIQFPSGSNLPHIFVQQAKYPNFFGIYRINSVGYVPSRFEFLKPVDVRLACGHMFVGIVYMRSHIDGKLNLLTPENFERVCIQCPNCLETR